jgi:hypothetical protein
MSDYEAIGMIAALVAIILGVPLVMSQFINVFDPTYLKKYLKKKEDENK